jgi:ribonuclease PH
MFSFVVLLCHLCVLGGSRFLWFAHRALRLFFALFAVKCVSLRSKIFHHAHIVKIDSMYYRSDNRAPGQLRLVNIISDYIKTAEGSALIEVGNTRVICTASVEETVPAFLRNSGRGWITAEYGMLPRSTLTRSPREAARGRIGGRTHEIQRLIGRSLRAVADLEKLGERSVLVDCDVIQADGGTRTASITGAFVALALALQKLVEAGTLDAVPLTDSVTAVSVGIVDGTPLLDLSYEEDSRADVDMNLVMTSSDKFVELQATAERHAFADDQLQALIALGRSGLRDLLAKQKAAVSGMKSQ